MTAEITVLFFVAAAVVAIAAALAEIFAERGD